MARGKGIIIPIAKKDVAEIVDIALDAPIDDRGTIVDYIWQTLLFYKKPLKNFNEEE